MRVILTLVILIIATSICHGCLRRSRSNWRRPSRGPRVVCPHVRWMYIADRGRTTSVVNWSRPRVLGYQYRVQQIGKQGPGSSFKEGLHRLNYVLLGGGKVKPICRIRFRVKVIRCSFLRNPKHGKIKCEGNKYGDICNFHCNKGHALIGSSATMCQLRGRWNRPMPRCVAGKCSLLPPPSNALPFKCHHPLIPGAICILRCKRGFRPARDMYAKCTDKGHWQHRGLACKDHEPPEFTSCPVQTIHQTANPHGNLTAVVWPKIKAKDNSGRLKIVSPSRVTLIGGKLPIGTHILKFEAKDDAGNKARTCSFVVEVEAKECSPPHLTDRYIRTPSCLAPFADGTQCKVECPLDIPLSGSKYITCRMDPSGSPEAATFWDWGQEDKPPKSQPSCTIPACPTLKAPPHGAVACDKWLGGQMCQLLCQKGYDVPNEFEKYYICPINTGVWNSDRIPGCESTIPGWGQTLTAAYIFKGQCSEVKDEVKSSFIKMLTGNNLCSGKHCTVKNVKVTCGSARRKRDNHQVFDRVRRGANINYIVFELSMQCEELSGLSVHQVTKRTTTKLLQILTNIKKNGSFAVLGRKVTPMAVRHRIPEPICKEGSVRARKSKTSCVPCPTGMFQNTDNHCQTCPVGSYQDRPTSLACVTCPVGHTTLKAGTVNKSQCVAQCSPGQYSATGVVPCSGCSPGSYQPHVGSKACLACPTGMRTKRSGSKFLLDCIPYDILFQGPVAVSMASTSSSDVCEFTFSVWIKVASPAKKAVIFEIYHPKYGKQFLVELGTSTKMQIGKDKVNLKKGMKKTWSHVAFTWSRRSIYVFQNGRQVWHRERKSKQCPIPGQASLTIKLASGVYALMQSLNVIPSANVSIVNLLAKSCEANLDPTIFSVNGLNISSLDRVLEVTPSTCLKSDACDSNPCGRHTCVPHSSGFRCVCKGGYSGDGCKQPPDYCTDNQCSEGSTCLADVTGGYRCVCPTNVTGMLCSEGATIPEWSEWGEWGTCSSTCGAGTTLRRRLCNIDVEQGDSACPGKDSQNKACQQDACPDCRETDLVVGKGVTTSCVKKGKSVSCSIKCHKGLVFSEEPVKYNCSKGEWYPDSITQSCTVPKIPYTVGVKYSVLVQTEVSIMTARRHLVNVGSTFTCVQNNRCRSKVKVTPCSKDSDLCRQHGGGRMAQLMIFSDLQPGLLNLSEVIQTPNMSRYSSLFNTWDTFRQNSSEKNRDTEKNRQLGIQKQGSDVLLFPRSNRTGATRVGGDLAKLLSAWQEVDQANWEVRKDNYIALGHTLHGQEAAHVVAEQDVTCEEGSVPGGLFCMKCAPGTYFSKDSCTSCSAGFYQDKEGQLECKQCPGFSTTSVVGASSSTSCKASERSDLHIMMTNGDGTVSSINVATLSLDTLNLTSFTGTLSLLAYSAIDDVVYYSTTSPTVLGSIKWDGSRHNVSRIMRGREKDVTGLAVDERSGILFYTLYSGVLMATTPDLKLHIIILTGLQQPRDLLIDQQKYAMYWAEGNTIMRYKYGQKDREPIVSRDMAVWALALEPEANKLTWFSRGDVFSCQTDGRGVEKILSHATVYHGAVEDYHFYVDSEDRLVRVNNDGKTKATVMTLKASPKSVLVVSKSESHWRLLPCRQDNSCQGLCWQTGQHDTVCLCPVSRQHYPDCWTR